MTTQNPTSSEPSDGRESAATVPGPRPPNDSTAPGANTESRHGKVRLMTPGKVSRIASNYGIVIFLILMFIAFTAALPSKFFTGVNFAQLLSDNAIPAILAIAVVLPLAAGEFDLSVAANLGFCSVLSAYVGEHGWPTIAIIVVPMIVGGLIGIFNAVLVVGIGINAFIATLGVATVLAGGNLALTGGSTIYNGIGPSITRFVTWNVDSIQFPVMYALIVALIVWYLLEHAPFGRYLRATGLGRTAARLSGVRTSRYLASAFIIAGFLAGVCGFLETATFGSATASVGPGFLLPAYAAAFLGATTIRPGMFNVWGTVIGVMILAVGINGLTLAGAPTWVSDVFNGFALIVAVSAAVLVGKHQERARS